MKMTKSQLIAKINELTTRNTELEFINVLHQSPESFKEASWQNILPTEEETGELELADIIDIPAIQSLIKNFYNLVRVTVAMVDLKGNVLVCEGWQDICTKFHRIHFETCRGCTESDTQFSSGVPFGEYKLYKCLNNMWDASTPIMVGGRHIGNVFTGQFFFEDEQVDYEFFRSQARQYGFPEEAYMAALKAVPRLSRESLDAVMSFFMRLAQIISQLSYTNVKLAKSLAERDALLHSLATAEGNYKKIFDNAIEGIYRTSPSGKFLEANQALAHIFGYETPEELMNKVIHVGKQLHVDPEGRERFISAMEQKDYATYEALMFKQDGSTCFVRLKGRAIRNSEGKTIYYEGFAEDITDRKQAEEERRQYHDHLEELVMKRTSQLSERNQQLTSEIAERKRVEEALRESENRYRTIFENTGTATLIFDEDTTISMINAEHVRMFHYTKEEVEGKKSWRDMIQEEELERLMEYHHLRAADPDLPPSKYELKAVDRFGHIRDVYVTIAMIPGTNKRVASLMDIMPLKEVENALRERETHYRALFENAGVAIAHVDARGNYLSANDNFVSFIGYTREELKNITPMDITHADYREQARDLISKQRSGKIGQFTLEMYYTCKDGTLRWGETRITPIRDEQGSLLSAVVAIVDRTQQKQAEDKLKKYLAEIEDLYENAPCGYHSLGEDGTYLRINNTELSWLGYSRDEVIGKMKLPDLLTPEGKETFKQKFPIFKKQGWARNHEYHLIRKDGGILPVLINATAVYDENGHFLMSRGSLFDNTERKKMADALAKRESLYRNLFENASIGMFQSTLEGRFLRINKAYAAMLGYESPEEVISAITDTSTQVHADSGNRAELLAALEREGWYYAEQPYLRKDGSIMIGQLAVRKVNSPNGVTAYLEGIVEDITERKRAEEALMKSERELRMKAQDLMEVNTTMRVLLSTMEKDQEDLKERFLTNIKDQVTPYLDKLKKSPLQEVQKGYLQMAEDHLNEIASPFVQKLTSNFLKLTKKEIQIAVLVKEGKTSKEIAELLNSKKRVIEFHRENIRKKLGLNNKKENLAILLRSFS